MRCLLMRLHVMDLLCILARTVASSLEMYLSRFSKSSPCNRKIPLNILEKSPLRFFFATTSGTVAASFLLASPTTPLSSAIIIPFQIALLNWKRIANQSSISKSNMQRRIKNQNQIWKITKNCGRENLESRNQPWLFRSLRRRKRGKVMMKVDKEEKSVRATQTQSFDRWWRERESIGDGVRVSREKGWRRGRASSSKMGLCFFSRFPSSWFFFFLVLFFSHANIQLDAPQGFQRGAGSHGEWGPHRTTDPLLWIARPTPTPALQTALAY